MAYNPPGHMPGVHIPGTLTPIGAVVELQRQQAAVEHAATQAVQLAQQEAADSTINLLLLFDDG